MTGLDGVNALPTSSFAHQVISCHKEPAPCDPPAFYGCRFSTFSTCFCHGGAFAHGNSSSVPLSARSLKLHQVHPSALTHESSTVRWRQVYVVPKKWMSKKRIKTVPRWLRWNEILASLANDCKDNLNVAWWKWMFNDIYSVPFARDWGTAIRFYLLRTYWTASWFLLIWFIRRVLTPIRR